jgi:hypothetical protein
MALNQRCLPKYAARKTLNWRMDAYSPGSRREELADALDYYHWGLVEYRNQVDTGGQIDALERFHASVVEPALKECERLAAGLDDEEFRLVEELRQCPEENLSASRELRNPSKSMLAQDYAKLQEKANVLQEKCHKVRLALRKHRKTY